MFIYIYSCLSKYLIFQKTCAGHWNNWEKFPKNVWWDEVAKQVGNLNFYPGFSNLGHSFLSLLKKHNYFFFYIGRILAQLYPLLGSEKIVAISGELMHVN